MKLKKNYKIIFCASVVCLQMFSSWSAMPISATEENEPLIRGYSSGQQIVNPGDIVYGDVVLENKSESPYSNVEITFSIEESVFEIEDGCEKVQIKSLMPATEKQTFPCRVRLKESTATLDKAYIPIHISYNYLDDGVQKNVSNVITITAKLTETEQNKKANTIEGCLAEDGYLPEKDQVTTTVYEFVQTPDRFYYNKFVPLLVIPGVLFVAVFLLWGQRKNRTPKRVALNIATVFLALVLGTVALVTSYTFKNKTETNYSQAVSDWEIVNKLKPYGESKADNLDEALIESVNKSLNLGGDLRTDMEGSFSSVIDPNKRYYLEYPDDWRHMSEASTRGFYAPTADGKDNSGLMSVHVEFTALGSDVPLEEASAILDQRILRENEATFVSKETVQFHEYTAEKRTYTTDAIYVNRSVNRRPGSTSEVKITTIMFQPSEHLGPHFFTIFERDNCGEVYDYHIERILDSYMSF